jgi:hypothetical protein
MNLDPGGDWQGTADEPVGLVSRVGDFEIATSDACAGWCSAYPRGFDGERTDLVGSRCLLSKRTGDQKRGCSRAKQDCACSIVVSDRGGCELGGYSLLAFGVRLVAMGP